jgi:hypothetical protein
VDLREFVWGSLSRSSWLRIGTGGGLLWILWWTFGFWRHEVSYLVYSDGVQLYNRVFAVMSIVKIHERIYGCKFYNYYRRCVPLWYGYMCQVSTALHSQLSDFFWSW